MTAKPNLQVVPVPPSPGAVAREQLAEKIDRRTIALASLENLRELMGRLGDERRRAFQQLDEAETRLAGAEGDPAALVAQLLSDAPEGSSLDECRAAIAIAKSRIEELQQGEQALQTQIDDAKLRTELATQAILRAVQAVGQAELSPDVLWLLEQGRALQEQLIAVRVRLRFMHRHGLLDADAIENVERYLRDVFFLPSCAGQVEHQAFDNHPAERSLRDALNALSESASASLPDLSSGEIRGRE